MCVWIFTGTPINFSYQYTNQRKQYDWNSVAIDVKHTQFNSIHFSDDFKKHCNTSSNPLKITSDGSISLSYSTDSPITTSCTVSVYNPDHLNQTARVMAYFTSFDVDCKRSRMDIYDDKGTESAKALTGMCYLFRGNLIV